jgi:hypothetical protein
MKTPLDNDLNKVYESFNQEHNHLRESLMASLPGRSPAKTIGIRKFIGDTIMKSRMTKLAVAAAIIIAVVLSITFLDKSVTSAYAIEQTIEANHVMSYLHTKYFHGEHNDVAKECWFEFDESGQVRNLRINWSEWFGGGYVIVWSENETKSWVKKRNFLRIFNDEIYTSRVYNMMETDDPKLMVEHLYEHEAKGEVEIGINESPNKAEPIVVTATYLPKSPSYGDRKILFIDRSTKLVTSLELYILKDGEYEYYGVIEYYNYNIPIDAKMFSLEDEVSPDAKRIDTRTEDVGLAQEGLADHEIATKVVREFLEALITREYVKASQIHVGLSPSEIRKLSEAWKVVRIVSIGKPVQPDKPSKIHPKRLCVACTIEVKKNGQLIQELREFRVTPVIGRRDRWEIQGSKFLKL